MKIYYIDTDYGYQDVLTQDELLEDYSLEELEAIKSNPENIVMELPYTLKQYKRALKLRDNEKFCDKFEDDFSYSPSLKDILEYLYPQGL